RSFSRCCNLSVSRRKHWTGTALATAVGSGGGLVKSIWDKGNDVVIPVNTVIDLILTQPITVNPVNNEDKSFGQ
ncbi:MAG: hypothetical protein K2F57_00445, partial [Candidatus Gastranaerophilales bacterium]|nr:hypothetical protein [Candidatus Gastranaerophilales bacterium]